MEERFKKFLLTAPKDIISEFIKQVKALNDPTFDELTVFLNKNI